MSLRGPARPAGLVVAVKEEADAVLTRMLARTKGKLGKFPFWRGPLAKREVAMILCGPGAGRAEEAARLLVERQSPNLLISAGFSGGLKTGQNRGDILFGTRILPAEPGGETFEVDPRVLRGAKTAMSEFQEQGRVGGGREYQAAEATLVTRSKILVTSHEKRLLAQESGADGVDMESRGVVALAREKDLPWVAVRAISDTVEEDLPLDFNQFLGPGGEPDRMKIVLHGLTRPALFGKLMELRKTTQEVGGNLVLFLELLLRELIGGG